MTKTLHDLLHGVTIKQWVGPTHVPIVMVCSNSCQVVKDSCFVAIPGTQVDGHSYIANAIEAGSRAIVCEVLPEPADLNTAITYVVVGCSTNALGIIASNFYDNPSSKLKIIAVTGTNGKTTIVHLLYHMAIKMGLKVGMLSTICNKILDKTHPATHTTPDQIQLHSFLHLMVTAGCSYCFMEASSHAIVQERLAGVILSGAVFTNITPEHLDYHMNFSNYIQAKKKLFDSLSSYSFALVNQEDKNHTIIIQNCKAQKYTFSLQHTANFRGRLISNTLQGLEIEIEHKSIWMQLIGTFNASNILSAYGVAQLLGLDSHESLTALSTIPPIMGRMNILQYNRKPLVVIDYAHTPDAIEKVIATLRRAFTTQTRLITIMGCGGNRDKQKRAHIGKILSVQSDVSIFTSDNPRYEAVEEIVQDMQKGVPSTVSYKVLHILDRTMAIKKACLLAGVEDVLLIAGKGHQHYEEVQGVKQFFCEEEIVQALFMQ